MKKAFIGLLILILSAWAQYVFSAEPIQLARMNPYVAGGARAAAQWSYNSDTKTDTVDGTTSQYALGAPVTISAATNVTALAFKVKGVGSATGMKICLHANTTGEGTPPLACGTCIPSDESWCIANVTYTATASTTYIVSAMTDVNMTNAYGKSSGATGVYGGTRSYATFDSGNNIYSTYTMSWAVAICTGGICVTP
jgi:hypothetical protein